MVILSKIPEVSKCCFCGDLKQGTVMIAIAMLSGSIVLIALLFFGFWIKIEECTEESSPWRSINTVFKYIEVAFWIYVAITCAAFLIGMRSENECTTKWFTWTILIVIIFLFISIIYTIILLTKGCFLIFRLIAEIIKMFVHFHFLQVFKSQYSDMFN